MESASTSSSTHRHALGNEYLSGLRLAAETRCEIGNCADRAIFPSSLKADGANGRIALGDADPEVEIVAQLSPLHA